jgi:hypothetical protein
MPAQLYESKLEPSPAKELQNGGMPFVPCNSRLTGYWFGYGLSFDSPSYGLSKGNRKLRFQWVRADHTEGKT